MNLDKLTRITTGYAYFKSKLSGAIKRLLQDKLEEFVSVDDFGAIGDGVADDSDAVQFAFNQAIVTAQVQRSCVVRFTGGKSYLIKRKLSLYSGTILDMNGATLLKGFDTSSTGTNLIGCLYSQANPAKGIKVYDGVFDNQGSVFKTQASIFEFVGISGLTFDNCQLLNVAGAHAIDLQLAHNVRVNRCDFLGFNDWVGDRNFSDAIQVETPLSDTGFVDLVVSECTFGASDTMPSWAVGVGNHGSVDGAPPVRGVSILYCNFKANTYAGVRGFSRWEDIKIHGNTFSDFTVPAITFTGRKVTDTIRETSRGVSIKYNTFDNCTGSTVIVCLAPTITAGVVGTTVYHRSWQVSENTFNKCTGTMIDLRWVNVLSICGNVVDECSGIFFRGTFVYAVNFSGNTGGSEKAMVLILEDNQTYNGTGLTGRIAINGNTIPFSLRAVHINCACVGFSITSNICGAVSGAAVFATDTSASHGLISDNKYLNPVGSEILVDVTASCSNVQATNNSGPSANKIKNLATGLSPSVVFGEGIPNGVQRGNIGSSYYDMTAGKMYIKETNGNNDTGWVMK